MYIQTCVKGVSDISSVQAKEIINGRGLACNWWRHERHISPSQIDERLTAAELDLHVNSYDQQHPSRTGIVSTETPFISLTAGAVERSVFLRTNLVHPAHRTALFFASKFGSLRGDCFLFYCWVVVGLRPSVEVKGLAEEIRELNTYRRYSAFQTEGELAAKIEVPARQIHRYERYSISQSRAGRPLFSLAETAVNSSYIDPHSVVNLREAF